MRNSNMRPKYSVIIPVYNAEKTIRRCLKSLLNDRFVDAEIILVNDGSNDKSGEICLEYANNYSNVRYIDKENGGVSTARNAGLDVANGDYVLFVDSDDYVAAGYFFAVNQMIEQTSCDLIQFSYLFDNGIEKRNRMYMPIIVNGRNQLMPHISNAICRKTINAPWAKLYRRALIEKHHIRFPEGVSVAEDRAFNIKYSMYIHSYAVSDQIIYCVSTENENSLTRSRHNDLNVQFSITRQFFLDALTTVPISTNEKEQYRRAYNFGDCRSIYHDAKLLHQDHMGWIARQKHLGKLCREINQRKMKYPKSKYCTLITLPVRMYLTPVIDVIAWKLSR